MPNVLSITIEHEPATDVTRALFDGLSRANVERTGDGKIELLCVIARDSSKALAGGLYGELYWGWLSILALWVSPDMRRQGLGSQLLSRAEAEACAKGCRGVHLDTFTFQNVALYTRAAPRTTAGRSTRSLDVIGDAVEVTLHSVITCPECGATAEEEMPTDACIFFYECKGCRKLLKPLAGDCCVFCSFGSVKCPPIQLEKGCCA